jgi:hypothetical protein
MSQRFNKQQKHEVISDLDRLAANARKTWKDFPIDVLAKAWVTKTNVLKAIVKDNGGNGFKLPHAKDMEDFDWETMCEQWEDEEDASEHEEDASEDEEDEDEEDEDEDEGEDEGEDEEEKSDSAEDDP